MEIRIASLSNQHSSIFKSMGIITHSPIRDLIQYLDSMGREIRSTMILHQYIGIFIATVLTILSQIQFPIIEITIKDRSATPRIKIEIEETRKDLLKDINFNLRFSILRDRKDLQEKIVVISIISKLNNLLCPLKIYFKAFLLMQISCSKFK